MLGVVSMGFWEGLEMKNKEERRKNPLERCWGTAPPKFLRTASFRQALVCHASLNALDSLFPSGYGYTRLLKRQDPLETQFFPYLLILVPR